MSKTTTIYHRDGRERTLDVHEASRLVGTGTIREDKEWSLQKPPPIGWEREIPKYRATRDVHPALKERHRHEPPFGMTMDNDCWQYAPRPIKAGEIIETKDWPHPSFFPLNFGAGKVLEFFRTRQKSRMALRPWHGDSIRLDDGLSGTTIVSVVPPQLKSMDLRPAS
jgi:hypothetical protein